MGIRLPKRSVNRRLKRTGRAVTGPAFIPLPSRLGFLHKNPRSVPCDLRVVLFSLKFKEMAILGHENYGV